MEETQKLPGGNIQKRCLEVRKSLGDGPEPVLGIGEERGSGEGWGGGVQILRGQRGWGSRDMGGQCFWQRQGAREGWGFEGGATEGEVAGRVDGDQGER